MFSIRQYCSLFILLFGMLTMAWSQDATTCYKKGAELNHNGNNAQALVYANKALQQDSTVADYYLLRARIHYALGKYNAAIHDCYSTSRIQPRKPEVYFLRGQIANVTESYVGAVMLFGKAIQNTNDPEILAQAYLSRGQANMNLKRYTNALEDLQQAQHFDVGNALIHKLMAQTYLHLGRVDEASEMNDNLLLTAPQDPSSYMMRAQIAEQKGEFAVAIQAYQEYIGLMPEDYNAFNSLALIYLSDKDYSSSLMNLQHAIQLAPNEPALYKTHGRILIGQGKMEKACNSLFKALQLGYLDQYGYDLLELYQSSCEEE